MTNQLIPVFESQINNETNLLCDARELHAFLQVGKQFASWIMERITDYGFIENQDFILLTKIGKQKGRGGHNKKGYHLTLDTAKELAMVERNDKGREIRRYFIECEKRLRASFNQSTTNSKSTADDRTPLRDAINLLVSKKHILYPEAYSYVHQRFNVKHINELEPSMLPVAVEYVHKLALVGELLEAEQPESKKDISFDKLIPFSF
ncbi:antA/AntB antirepressor family protein [Thorsellia anophelis]|uniref:Phage anti-repressor protein n=1 Tax=Thorsellia anophelis DSM 18579 TaxID=1123402 RepID=A0A1I0D5D4_9GAMM|nr:antA/AntB antirepressor family protein [Thorsellia anophelis]SET27374.1 Phage anti-repressor protein [Thorsellia anophelis DSM 18579]